MKESRESFRKIGLTFEGKAFYDILLALRDQYDFEYGTDKEVDGAVINDKCKALAQKVKEIIDTKSSFADWLNNQNVRNQLKLEIKICLVKTAILHSTAPKFSKRSWSRSRTLRRTIKSSIKKKIQLYSGFTLKYSCIFCIANNCCVFS